MINIKFYVRYLAFYSIIIGCGSIKIKSTPEEAEISVLTSKKGEQKILGKTPFEKDFSDLEDLINSGPVVLSIKKTGYREKRLIIPNISSTLEIDTTLSPNMAGDYKDINNIVALVLNAERLLMSGRHQEALKASEKIKSINPNIASAYEISGSAFFFLKKFKEARFEWQRALELDSGNPEAEKILSLIEKTLEINK